MIPSNLTVGEMFFILLCVVFKEKDVAHFKAFFATLGDQRTPVSEDILTKVLREVNSYYKCVRLSEMSYVERTFSKLVMRFNYSSFAVYIVFSKEGLYKDSLISFSAEDRQGNVLTQIQTMEFGDEIYYKHRAKSGADLISARRLLGQALLNLDKVDIARGKLITHQPWHRNIRQRFVQNAMHIDPFMTARLDNKTK